MKRALIALLLILVILVSPALVFASDISSADMKGTITVTNNGTALTNATLVLSLSSAELIAQGWIDADVTLTGLALRTSAGADAKFMPSVNATIPMCIWVPSIGAYFSVNYLMYTSQSDVSCQKFWFPGAGGMTVADSASLELGDNFTLEWKGELDTDSGTLVDKPHAINVSQTSGNITASIYTTTSGATLTTSPVSDNSTAIASVNGAATHWEAVSDSDNTTYVYTTSLTQQKDYYNIAAPSFLGVSQNITSVTMYFVLSSNDPSASASGQPYLKIGATELAGTEVSTTTGGTTKSEVLTRPGGGAWLASDFSSLRVGAGLKISNASYRGDIHKVWLVIDYSYDTVAASTSAVGVASVGHTVEVKLEPASYTTSFTPDSHPETVSIDGVIYQAYAVAAGVAWGTIQPKTGGTTADGTATGDRLVGIGTGTGANTWYLLSRSFCLFNTASLPASATVTSATLAVRGYTKEDAVVITPTINVFASSPASDIALVIGDYDQVAAVPFATAITYAGWSTTGYNTFTLNAAGRAAIDIAGVSKFSLREATYDAPNNPPVWNVGNKISGFSGWFNEKGVGFQPTLTVTYTASRLGIYIDGVLVNSTQTDTSVPNNANPLTFCSGATQDTIPMPYVEYVKVTTEAAGGLAMHQYWQYLTSWIDQSGNGNTATPTFRTASSDADLTASLTSFTPIALARAPAFSVANAPFFYTDNITATGNFTSNGTLPAGGPPGAAVIDEAADAGGTPRIWLWGLIAMFTCMMGGLGISAMVRHKGSGGGELVVRMIVATTVLGLMVTFGKFDWWIIVLYLMIAGAIAMFSRHGEWGGSISQHGLIGFLAMSWIGLTIINRIMEGQFITANEKIWNNYFAFTQEFKVFDIFSMPVLNFSFFTNGIPSLIKWDYSFFGGNAQMIQYMLYSITAVVSFVIFGLLIGLLYNAFRAR